MSKGKSDNLENDDFSEDKPPETEASQLENEASRSSSPDSADTNGAPTQSMRSDADSSSKDAAESPTSHQDPEVAGPQNANSSPTDSAPKTKASAAEGTSNSGAASITGTDAPAHPATSQAAPVSNDVLVANVGDQPTREDTLGFKPYVDAIASFLMNKVTKPPLTLSIEGEWGSGKSSFMLQLEAELRRRNAKVVRFNAWRHDKDDAMWAAFAMQFTRDLAGELSLIARWYAHLKLFARRFDWERGWLDMVRFFLMLLGLLAVILVPLFMFDRVVAFLTANDATAKSLGSALSGIVRAGGIIGYLAIVTLLGLKLKDVLGNPLNINLKQHLDTPDYRSRVAFIEHFHEDFAKVVDAYGQEEKVCVFIDDLDRCEVPKAADLMQALNLMISDNSHLIFIMGMDREKVAAGLAVKYEKLLPYLASAATGNGEQRATGFDPVHGLEYGYEFIEKFIQLPFVVPRASEDQISEFLERIFGTDGDSKPASPAVPTRRRASGKEAEEAVTNDSEMVSDILKMIAPTFEYNPRRMKQFINAFRLKTFIASRTLLFEAPANPVLYDRLTVYQLGKFVAICLRWPLLLADLDNERDLLSKLQKLVLADIAPERLLNEPQIKVYLYSPSEAEHVIITSSVKRWYERKNLREFLRAKLFSDDGGFLDKDVRQKYSLEKVDVNKLLQVSPVKKPIIRAQLANQVGTDSTAGTGPNDQIQNPIYVETSATYPKIYGAT